MAKKLTALQAALTAAREFKLLLDVQQPGTLFNPGGKGDARDSATYAYGTLLLAEATAQGLDRTQRPGVMHSDVMAIVDVIAEHRADMSADLLELLASVTVVLRKFGFEVSDQNGRGGEQSSPLKVGAGTTGNGDVVVEQVKGERNAVHEAASSEVVEQTLCHDGAAPIVDLLMKAAFEKPRDPRSAAYKLGTRSLLNSRVGGGAFSIPFDAGTVEFDAFFSGVDEGKAIWSHHQAKDAQ